MAEAVTQVSSVAYQAMQHTLRAQQETIANLRKNTGQGTPLADEERAAMQAEIDELRTQLASKRANLPGRHVGLKVSEKGGVSIYGLGRFPVTQYPDQWITLLNMENDLREFMTEHDAELKVKPVKE